MVAQYRVATLRNSISQRLSFGLLMGWSGRAPTLPASKLAGAPKTREPAMSPKFNSEIAVIGIDLGKNSYHLVGPGSALQPFCQQSKLAGAPNEKEHAMSQKLNS